MLIANGYIASRLKDNLVLNEVYRAAGYTGQRDLTAHIVVRRLRHSFVRSKTPQQ